MLALPDTSFANAKYHREREQQEATRAAMQAHIDANYSVSWDDIHDVAYIKERIPGTDKWKFISDALSRDAALKKIGEWEMERWFPEGAP